MRASCFYDLIGAYSSLSIIGMCKNAGKTTVLNHIIHSMAKKEQLLALTSIGRDGEETDIVSGAAKPGVYIYAGSLIATAAGLLTSCDITKEILLTTGINTPLGEVVIVRALSDGYVQLAGPSMISQLEQLSKLFLSFGEYKIIIDGAVGRKTLCSRSLSEATILCTGASCGNSLDAVVADTAHTYNMLSLRAVEDDILRQKIRALSSNKIMLCGKKYIPLPPQISIEEGLRQNPRNCTTHIFIDGALSDTLMGSLLFSAAELAGKHLIVRDASKILISAANYHKLRLKHSDIRVLDEINIVAVAANPFSVYGGHFDKDHFRAALKKQIEAPVINVEDM